MKQYISGFLLSFLIIFINKHVFKAPPFISHYFINPFTADDSNDYIFYRFVINACNVPLISTFARFSFITLLYRIINLNNIILQDF